MTMDNYEGCESDNCDWYFGVPFKSKRKAAVAAVKERGFKVGDRVRVVRSGWDDGGSYHDAKVGDVDTIIAGLDGLGRYEGREWFYYPHEIELIRAAFLPGTRIRLTRDHGVYKAGHRGTVTVENDENVGVLMDIGRYAAFPHDVVEIYDNTPRAFGDGLADYVRENLSAALDSAPDCAGRKVGREAKPKFKAGDVVRSKKWGGDGYTIACVKTRYGKGEPYEGEIAYDYTGDDGWDREESIELVTAAPCPQDNEQPIGRVEVSAGSWRVHVRDDGTISGFSEQPCIVTLIAKDGKPRPSSYPHVHATVAAATAEAERLARNNPGQEFAVYQRVAGRVASVSVDMKEVA